MNGLIAAHLPADVLVRCFRMLDYPFNFPFLFVHPILTGLMRGYVYRHVSVGDDILESTISHRFQQDTKTVHCAGRSHHDLRSMKVDVLRVDMGNHHGSLCPYFDEIEHYELIIDNVENPVHVLRHMASLPHGSPCNTICLNLDRQASFVGVPISYFDINRWRETCLEVNIPLQARFLPPDVSSQVIGFRQFFVDVKSTFRITEIPDVDPAVRSMSMDEWVDWECGNSIYQADSQESDCSESPSGW